MNKLGLVFDSTCGLTYDEAESKGIGFIPLVVIIDGETYGAGKDLFQNDLYKKMENRDVVIQTSLPGAEDVEKAFDKALETNEKVIYVGMSHKFSGANNAIRVMVEQNEKYKGRVFVAKSEFSSPWMPLYAKEIIEMVKNYDDPELFESDLIKCNDYMVGYLSPGDIWWFYKGGRISKMQYMLGSIAKISPILKVKDGEIDKTQTLKARGIKKAMSKMVEAIKGEVERLKLPASFFKYIMLDTGNAELKQLSKDIMCAELGIKESDVIFTGLTTEQTAHMGPNSFGLTIYVSLKNIINGGLK